MIAPSAITKALKRSRFARRVRYIPGGAVSSAITCHPIAAMMIRRSVRPALEEPAGARVELITPAAQNAKARVNQRSAVES